MYADYCSLMVKEERKDKSAREIEVKKKRTEREKKNGRFVGAAETSGELAGFSGKT